MLGIAILHECLLVFLQHGLKIPRGTIPPSMNFPAWEIAAVIVGWNPLCLSATMAISRILKESISDTGDWVTVMTAASVMLLFQIPWVVCHFRFVHHHIYGDEPSVHFKQAPIMLVLSSTPSCAFSAEDSIGGRIRLLWEWVEFTICVPFRLGYQGGWLDHPNTTISGFPAMYGPLFSAYSPNAAFSHLFGPFLLLKKMAVIWILGSTVQDVSSVVESSVFQIWLLCAVHLVVLFLMICQTPFNERIENVIQGFVTFQQMLFFALLAITLSDKEPEAKEQQVCRLEPHGRSIWAWMGMDIQLCMELP